MFGISTSKMFYTFDNRVGDGFSLELHSLIIPEHLCLSSGLSLTEKRKHFISSSLKGFFFPVIEAVKNATEIKFIDWWRSCLSTSIYPFIYSD